MALDILILVVIGAALIIGAMRGAISQIGSVVGIVASIAAARLFGEHVARFFAGGEAPGALDYAAGYTVVFLSVYVLAWVIVRLFRKVVHGVHLGIIDRIGGAFIKMFVWGMILSLALNLYLLIKGDEHCLDHPKKPWRAMIVRLAPTTLGFLKHELND